MTAFSRVLLSGTPANGRVIPVAAAGSPGTVVHTAVAGDGAFDEVDLWASNVTGTAATLTIQWGGLTDPGDMVVKGLVIPANSAPVSVLSGQVINGGLEVRAFSGTANAINLSGRVTRIQ